MPDNRNYDFYENEEIEMAKRQRLTGKQRAQYKKEREALIGSLITQEGALRGALVKSHVRGSQYVLCLANGTEVYASHKKQRESRSGASESISQSGWSLWEDCD
jgi:hypothetical protein